jgi:hypothetical protein
VHDTRSKLTAARLPQQRSAATACGGQFWILDSPRTATRVQCARAPAASPPSCLHAWCARGHLRSTVRAHSPPRRAAHRRCAATRCAECQQPRVWYKRPKRHWPRVTDSAARFQHRSVLATTRTRQQHALLHAAEDGCGSSACIHRHFRLTSSSAMLSLRRASTQLSQGRQRSFADGVIRGPNVTL